LFLANGLTLFVNVFVALVIPKAFSASAYSFFQLENLFCTYIWIISLGWHEGILLKYGGKRRDEIDSGLIAFQVVMLGLYMVVVSTLLFLPIGGALGDADRRFVLLISFTSVSIEAVIYSLTYVLRATNRIRASSILMGLDRIVYMMMVVGLIIFRVTSFHWLLQVDILSKVVMLIVCLVVCRDFVFVRLPSLRVGFSEAVSLISMGINITLANFAGGLVNGVARLAIESRWGLLIFGKVSLTLSISNAVTRFLSVFSVALFPALRQVGADRLPVIYRPMRALLTVALLCCFVAYAPIKAVLVWWLPNYADGLRYLALLFPVSLFDLRVLVLVNTYLKVVRKERIILLSNGVIVALSVVLSGVSVFVLNSLDVAVFSLVVLSVLRCALAESFLPRYLQVHVLADTLFEVGLTVVFIVSAWVLPSGGWAVYLGALVVYLVARRKRIQADFHVAAEIVRKPKA